MMPFSLGKMAVKSITAFNGRFKMKIKLVSSHSTIENLNKLINEYFYSKIELKENSPGLWSLFNSKGKIKGFRVTKRSNRYRLEMEMVK